MRFIPLACATLTLCLVPGLTGETLGDALAAHHVAMPSLPSRDLQQRITSYAVSTDNSPFLLAYYDEDGSGMLAPLLHVLRYDERTRSLQRADLHGAEVPFHGFHGVMEQVSNTCLGSALAVSEKEGLIAIETHINPSAGCVLVLTPDLSFSAGLWGWVLARIHEQIIFEESMVHFANTHEAHLSVYDSKQRQTVSLYPARVDDARRQFSAELRKHLPSSEWCAQQNDPCNADSFSTDIDHVVVHEQERNFEFDARMYVEGSGEDAAPSVQPRTVHYVCRQPDGKWSCSPK